MAISATKKVESTFEGLNIKWDRTIIFLLGCAALFLAIITGILAPLTVAVTWPWPVFLMLVGAGSIAALRYLAVQERRERAAGATDGTATDSVVENNTTARAAVFNNQAHVEAESVRREQQQRADLDLPEDQTFLDNLHFAEDSQDSERSPYNLPAEQPAPQQLPERLTDAELEVAASTKVARDIPTHDELVAAARKVAQKSAESAGSTWEPVPVPKPTYARTAVVHRQAPQALEVPKTPVADRGLSLKDAAKAPQPETNTAGINLDDVLNRRRA
ncbi:hypothetical protein [Kocuria sp.]|uniref:hypothetical protein n=1 Tax=Kocuria sp. TaxID=1871328 RepID=UPI0026DF7132|nr:hypothetical protein [Kocuria sp.]MDO5617309.1 hypothetical protein [Kocuria sp.]